MAQAATVLWLVTGEGKCLAKAKVTRPDGKCDSVRVRDETCEIGSASPEAD